MGPRSIELNFASVNGTRHRLYAFGNLRKAAGVESHHIVVTRHLDVVSELRVHLDDGSTLLIFRGDGALAAILRADNQRAESVDFGLEDMVLFSKKNHGPLVHDHVFRAVTLSR